MRCKCGSTHLVKSGFRVTRTGKRQRMHCQNCGRSFYSDKGNKTKKSKGG